jgi:hypothetical protein
MTHRQSDPHAPLGRYLRGLSATHRSEGLRAERRPGRPEQRTRAFEGARTQLAHSPTARECMEVERSEVDGCEIADVEFEVSVVVGALDRCADAVSALVPRAQPVVHLEDDGLGGRVAASTQCGLDVDETQPQTVE